MQAVFAPSFYARCLNRPTLQGSREGLEEHKDLSCSKLRKTIGSWSAQVTAPAGSKSGKSTEDFQIAAHDLSKAVD
jgi:hypothetical protein